MKEHEILNLRLVEMNYNYNSRFKIVKIVID